MSFSSSVKSANRCSVDFTWPSYPRNALLEAGDLLSQHQLFGGKTCSPRLQLGALPLEYCLDLRVGRARHERRRHLKDITLPHFRFEAGLHRQQSVLPKDEPPQLGFGRRVVHAHEHLVGLDKIALLGQQVADDAALEVLDELVLPRGDECAGGNDRAAQRGQPGPDAEATDPEQENGEAGDGRPPGAERNAPGPLVHAVAGRPSFGFLRRTIAGPFGCASPRAGGAFAARRVRTTRCRTSAGRPNASARPLRRISTLSTLFSSAGRSVTTATVTRLSFARARVSVRACSPAASRFELGSSSTTSAGLPKKARARAMRCFCPPERGAPPRSSTVS